MKMNKKEMETIVKKIRTSVCDILPTKEYLDIDLAKCINEDYDKAYDMSYDLVVQLNNIINFLYTVE